MREEKSRAKMEILNYITNFCLTHVYDKQRTGSLHGFISTLSGGKDVEVGDLVALQSAPTSKWHLSWLSEIDTTTNAGWPRYLLESIHDGELCWWHNVGLAFLERDERKSFPRWRWTDRQFEFNDRWLKVCYREKDAYITLPVDAVFGDDFIVTLGTRTRHGFDDKRPYRTYPDWRKVTKKTMAEFYDWAVAERDKKKAS